MIDDLINDLDEKFHRGEILSQHQLDGFFAQVGSDHDTLLLREKAEQYLDYCNQQANRAFTEAMRHI